MGAKKKSSRRFRTKRRSEGHQQDFSADDHELNPDEISHSYEEALGTTDLTHEKRIRKSIVKSMREGLPRKEQSIDSQSSVQDALKVAEQGALSKEADSLDLEEIVISDTITISSLAVPVTKFEEIVSTSDELLQDSCEAVQMLQLSANEGGVAGKKRKPLRRKLKSIKKDETPVAESNKTSATSSTTAPPQHLSSTTAPPQHLSSTTAPPQHLSSTTAPPQHLSSTTAPPQHLSSTTAPPQHSSSTTAPPQHLSSTTAPPQHSSSISSTFNTGGILTSKVESLTHIDGSEISLEAAPRNFVSCYELSESDRNIDKTEDSEDDIELDEHSTQVMPGEETIQCHAVKAKDGSYRVYLPLTVYKTVSLSVCDSDEDLDENDDKQVVERKGGAEYILAEGTRESAKNAIEEDGKDGTEYVVKAGAENGTEYFVKAGAENGTEYVVKAGAENGTEYFVKAGAENGTEYGAEYVHEAGGKYATKYTVKEGGKYDSEYSEDAEYVFQERAKNIAHRRPASKGKPRRLSTIKEIVKLVPFKIVPDMKIEEAADNLPSTHMHHINPQVLPETVGEQLDTEKGTPKIEYAVIDRLEEDAATLSFEGTPKQYISPGMAESGHKEGVVAKHESRNILYDDIDSDKETKLSDRGRYVTEAATSQHSEEEHFTEFSSLEDLNDDYYDKKYSKKAITSKELPQRKLPQGSICERVIVKEGESDKITIESKVYERVIVNEGEPDKITIEGKVYERVIVKEGESDKINIEGKVYETVIVKEGESDKITIKGKVYERVIDKEGESDKITIEGKVYKRVIVKEGESDKITIEGKVYERVVVKDDVSDKSGLQRKVYEWVIVKEREGVILKEDKIYSRHQQDDTYSDAGIVTKKFDDMSYDEQQMEEISDSRKLHAPEDVAEFKERILQAKPVTHAMHTGDKLLSEPRESKGFMTANDGYGPKNLQKEYKHHLDRVEEEKRSTITSIFLATKAAERFRTTQQQRLPLGKGQSPVGLLFPKYVKASYPSLDNVVLHGKPFRMHPDAVYPKTGIVREHIPEVVLPGIKEDKLKQEDGTDTKAEDDIFTGSTRSVYEYAYQKCTKPLKSDYDQAHQKYAKPLRSDYDQAYQKYAKLLRSDYDQAYQKYRKSERSEYEHELFTDTERGKPVYQKSLEDVGSSVEEAIHFVTSRMTQTDITIPIFSTHFSMEDFVKSLPGKELQEFQESEGLTQAEPDAKISTLKSLSTITTAPKSAEKRGMAISGDAMNYGVINLKCK